MWVYVPGNTSVSSPVRDLLISELESLSQMLSASCTSKGKLQRSKSWSAVLKKGRWTTLPFGAIAQQETMALCAARWMVSLPAGPVLLSPLLDDAKVLRTIDGCGRRFGEPYARLAQDGSWGKTSQACLPGMEDTHSEASSPIWHKASSMRNGSVCRRRKLVLPTSGSDSFCSPGNSGSVGASDSSSTNEALNQSTDSGSKDDFFRSEMDADFSSQTCEEHWPTPDGQIFQDNHQCTPEEWDQRRQRLKENAKTPNGNGCGTPLAMAAYVWATPGVPSGGGRKRSQVEVLQRGNLSDGTKRQIDLESEVTFWASPRSHEAGDYQRDGGTKDKILTLTGQAGLWARPNATNGDKAPDCFSRGPSNPSLPAQAKSCPCSPQVLATTDGVLSSADTLGLLLRYRRWLYSALGCPWKDMPTPEEELKANPVQLNPLFTAWLMGWLPAWPVESMPCDSAEMALWFSRQRSRLLSFFTD